MQVISQKLANSLLNRISHLLTIGALIFGFSFLITSCNSVRFLKFEKIKVLPGVPTGTPVFRYVLDVMASDQTVFTSIKVGSIIEVSSFSVIESRTNLQSNNDRIYDQGVYRLQFDVSYDYALEKSLDNVQVNYRQGDQTKSIHKKIKRIKTIRLK